MDPNCLFTGNLRSSFAGGQRADARNYEQGAGKQFSRHFLDNPFVCAWGVMIVAQFLNSPEFR